MGVVDETATQSAVEGAVDTLKGSYPELAGAKNAIVRYELWPWLDYKLYLQSGHRSKPHPTPKKDGRVDPLHANFQITDANNKTITSAHAYAVPLGGKYVWFSKPKYNNGQEAQQYFPQNPAKKTGDGKDVPGQQSGG